MAALLRSKSCDPIYVAARSVPTWYFYTSLEPLDNNLDYFLLQSIWRRDSPAFGDAAPSALHLPDPARQLVLRVGCREEVYGLASGTPNRNGLPPQGHSNPKLFSANYPGGIFAIGLPIHHFRCTRSKITRRDGVAWLHFERENP